MPIIYLRWRGVPIPPIPFLVLVLCQQAIQQLYSVQESAATSFRRSGVRHSRNTHFVKLSTLSPNRHVAPLGSASACATTTCSIRVNASQWALAAVNGFLSFFFDCILRGFCVFNILIYTFVYFVYRRLASIHVILRSNQGAYLNR